MEFRRVLFRSEFDRDSIFGFKSRTGHTIAVDDENNLITVQHKDGYFIELKEGEVVVGKDTRVVIRDEAIELGKADSLEPAVLGDKLTTWLDSLIGTVSNLKIDVAGSTGTLNVVSITDLELRKQELSTILAKYIT